MGLTLNSARCQHLSPSSSRPQSLEGPDFTRPGLAGPAGPRLSAFHGTARLTWRTFTRLCPASVTLSRLHCKKTPADSLQ